MDEQPPIPEPVNEPPASPPPPPLAPPPIIHPQPPHPPRGRSGSIWKVLTVLFLVLFVLSLTSNFVGVCIAVIPRSRAYDRAQPHARRGRPPADQFGQ